MVRTFTNWRLIGSGLPQSMDLCSAQNCMPEDVCVSVDERTYMSLFHALRSERGARLEKFETCRTSSNKTPISLKVEGCMRAEGGSTIHAHARGAEQVELRGRKGQSAPHHEQQPSRKKF